MTEGRQIAIAEQQQQLGAAAWLKAVRQDLAIAVIRAESLELSLQMARVAIAAGLKHIEITSTSAQFSRVIAQLRGNYPNCIIGTGTVVRAAVAKEALAAGAQFIFAPTTPQM